MLDDARAGAERACERLVVAYSHLIDGGEAARVGELFTEDGVWESAEVTMTGRDQITAGFSRRQANAGRRSRHVCTNLAIDVLSDTAASGRCYFTLWRADDVAGPVAFVSGAEMVGDYSDTFVLTDAGWRIRHRVATAAFVTSRPHAEHSSHDG